MSGALNAVGSAVATVFSFTILGMMFRGEDPKPQYLGEISKQTAKEGDPRLIVYGCVRPVGPNLIQCQEPKKRMVKQSSSGGGKGGSKKKEQKVEHVFRTYAMGVCEGPITSFRRIWRNNKLVYDGRGTAWGEKNNKVLLKSFRLYSGAWDQMPDPTLESIWGVGQVPAYRGTAYMVAIDEDLTELGGSVPQWLFEVERAEGTYLTSKPYNVEDAENSLISHYISGINYTATTIDSSFLDESSSNASISLIRFNTEVFVDIDYSEYSNSLPSVEYIDYSERGDGVLINADTEQSTSHPGISFIAYSQTIILIDSEREDSDSACSVVLINFRSV